MTARNLILGLDGADLSLIEQFGARALPTLHGLMARGAYAALQSVQPPATLPNWLTFLTGLNPGQHGVFDFTTRRGYGVKFTAGSIRQAPTIASRLDAMGKRCACLFFPGTFPPERLAHGIFISGWDAPVAFEADETFVWPRSLHSQLVQQFGPQRFGDVDEFDTENIAWHDQLPAALIERIQRRTELCEYLLCDRDWDLFAVYFGESDTASHHLWALHDPNSPRRPETVSASQQLGLLRVYQALDAALSRLVARAGGNDVEVTVVSDHGFGGASDRVLYLNYVLEQSGLLRFKTGSIAHTAVQWAKEAALTRLPLALRDRVFRWGGATLPSLLESRARFGAIDMSRTQVFSDELNYFPALHLNVRGREPQGIVERHEVDELIQQVEAALLSLRDPWNGEPVVAAVHRRETLFHGPYVERAPDLLVELHLVGGYSYNLMPSSGAPRGTGPFRKLEPAEYLGRKGRSLQGSHRDCGLFITAGPSVSAHGRVQARMADATATVLARMGLGSIPEADGHSIEVTSQRLNEMHYSAPAFRASTFEDDEEKVAARLRRLGYIE